MFYAIVWAIKLLGLSNVNEIVVGVIGKIAYKIVGLIL
jgi:hypothetical protein